MNVQSPRAGPSGHHRILVIDDNVDGAEMLRDILILEGHAAELSHNGPEGLALGREFRPEIVLCDIGLPGQDGYQVAKAMRRDPALREAFLIALTGFSGPEDQERATAAGFDAHLLKPISVDEIRSTIALAETGHHS